MKRIQSTAAAALLTAASAFAQTYEPAVPRGIPDSTGPQSRELAQPAPAAAPPAARTFDPVVPRLVMDRARGGNDADARRCLGLASNRQIHQCAHRYLPREARAKLTRTTAAKRTATAPAPVRSQSAADLGRADLSKAAAPGKTIDTAKVVPPAPATAAVVKPGATPKPAAPERTAEKNDRPPKWTDTAKAIIKKQGDRLPE